jgi:uncharacterized protein
MARITVKVHPRAKTTRIAGRLGGVYKLDLAAPPVDGKANRACLEFFADLAGVPRASVRILAGAAARTKVIDVAGVEQAEMERRLG